MKLDRATRAAVERIAAEHGIEVPGRAARGGKARSAADLAGRAGANSLVVAAPGRWVLEIPRWRPATLNSLTKVGNHFRAARLKRMDREIVAAYAATAGIRRAAGRRKVSLEVVRAGRMQECDPDAFWKTTLDALRAAGLLVDDSPAWVELGRVSQPKGAEPLTRIILEDLCR